MSYFDDHEDELIYGDWERDQREDGWDDPESPPSPRRVTCNRCGRAGLQWKQFDGRWRLAEYSPEEGLPMHRCAVAPEDDFTRV